MLKQSVVTLSEQPGQGVTQQTGYLNRMVAADDELEVVGSRRIAPGSDEAKTAPVSIFANHQRRNANEPTSRTPDEHNPQVAAGPECSPPGVQPLPGEKGGVRIAVLHQFAPLIPKSSESAFIFAEADSHPLALGHGLQGRHFCRQA